MVKKKERREIMNKKLEQLLPGSTLEEIKGKWGGARYYAVKGQYRGYYLILEPGMGTQGKPSGLLHVVINASIADALANDLVTGWAEEADTLSSEAIGLE